MCKYIGELHLNNKIVYDLLTLSRSRSLCSHRLIQCCHRHRPQCPLLCRWSTSDRYLWWWKFRPNTSTLNPLCSSCSRRKQFNFRRRTPE